MVILAKACTVQQRVCRSGKPMAIATVLLSMFNNLVNQVRSPKNGKHFLQIQIQFSVPSSCKVQMENGTKMRLKLLFAMQPPKTIFSEISEI